MKKSFYFLSLFLFSIPLFATQLLNYNIYDRNDRVDLMLSFDQAYEGTISQKKEQNLTLLTFDMLHFPKNELQKIKSSLVDKIQISSKNNKTFIMFENKEKVDLSTDSINNKFGLRIRILPQNTNTTNTPIIKEQTLQDKSPHKSFDYTTYILIMLVLVLLLLALWWLKRTMTYKNLGTKKFQIIFQRPLDKNNQFYVLDYENKRYTMIIGSSNILLETAEVKEEFEENKNDKEKNFDSFFEENKRKIQNLIQEKQKNKNL